jgi:hypothetical protein
VGNCDASKREMGFTPVLPSSRLRAARQPVMHHACPVIVSLFFAMLSACMPIVSCTLLHAAWDDERYGQHQS